MIWSLFDRVERAGRLVGEQQAALADDGAGDGDALLLTAGEVVGIAVEVVRQPDACSAAIAAWRAGLAAAGRRARAAASRSRPR